MRLLTFCSLVFFAFTSNVIRMKENMKEMNDCNIGLTVATDQQLHEGNHDHALTQDWNSDRGYWILRPFV